GEVARGGEEAGMGGDAADGECVLVVDLAPHEPAAPRVALGRRDARNEVARGAEHRALHAERLEHAPRDERVDRLARHALEHFAEQEEAEVAVYRLRPRYVGEVHRDDPPEELLLAADLLVERRPGLQPRRVGQQALDGYRLLRAPAEARDERG